MCNCKSDRPKLIRLVDEAYRFKGERWAIIENKSGNLEVIPESQVAELKEIKVNYTLKT